MSTTITSDQSLEIDRAQFRTQFPDLGFTIKHRLSDRPEFQLPRLVELARVLPETQVEYYTGNVGINQDPHSHPGNGLSIAETVRRIEECGSWMVLKNVQQQPAYHRLLREVLDEIYAECAGSLQGFHREEAFVFISSPGSVTPYHLDEEHNFLCQIAGTKEVSLWDPRDRTVLSEPQIEYMLQIWHDSEYHRNMPYKQEFGRSASVFTLHPGDALYFPVGAPHWVKNGPEVSISFSVTFRSEQSQRQAMVYFVNRKLRRLGIEPCPPGRSAIRDAAKCSAFELARRTGGIFGGSWLRRNKTKWA